MWKLALAVSVLGGIAAVADAGKAKRKGFRAAKHYAALFALDRTWTYTVTETKAHHDPTTFDEIVDTTTTTTTTCKVVEARRFENGAMSRVTCDAEGLVADTLANVWFATQHELSFYYNPDHATPATFDRVPKRALRATVIAAHPRDGADESQEMEEGSLFSGITRDHGAWCVAGGFQTIGKSGTDLVCYDKAGIRNGEDAVDEEDGPIVRITYARVD